MVFDVYSKGVERCVPTASYSDRGIEKIVKKEWFKRYKKQENIDIMEET